MTALRRWRRLAGGPLVATALRPPREAYWALPAAALVRHLASGADGLTGAAAATRRRTHGPNALLEHRRDARLVVLGRQLRRPLLWLLVFAAAISALTSAWLDAAIVLAIVVVTVALGYSREYRADRAAAALRAQLRTSTQVVRAGRAESIASEDVVIQVSLSVSPLRDDHGALVGATKIARDITEHVRLRQMVDAKGVHLETAIDASAGDVSGDAPRLLQVAGNLLSNTVEFTPAGGRVEVRAGRVGRCGELVVTDTGGAARQSSCRTSSSASGRPTVAPHASPGDSGSASPSSGTSSNSTAARWRRPVRARATARRSRCAVARRVALTVPHLAP